MLTGVGFSGEIEMFWNWMVVIVTQHSTKNFRVDLRSAGLISLQSKGHPLQYLLQYHSSKVSILQYSAFFMVQLSQLYVTTGKTIALTIWIVVNRVMSLVFKTLSRFVIAFLPRSKCFLFCSHHPQ